MWFITSKPTICRLGFIWRYHQKKTRSCKDSVILKLSKCIWSTFLNISFFFFLFVCLFVCFVLFLETTGWFWFNWSQMWLPFFHLWNCLVRIRFELFYVTGSKGMSRIWIILILELQTKKVEEFLRTCVLRWTLSKNCHFLATRYLIAMWLEPKFNIFNAQIGCVKKSKMNFTNLRLFSLIIMSHTDKFHN